MEWSEQLLATSLSRGSSSRITREGILSIRYYREELVRDEGDSFDFKEDYILFFNENMKIK